MFIFSWIWVIADLSRSEEFNKHGEKENRAFRSSSFLTPKKQLTGFAWNFLETPIQVCRGVSILYFNIPFIFFFFFFFLYLFPVFWGHLNPHVRINKKLNSVAYHPGPSRLVSKIHPFISLRNSLGLYLSLECLLNFVSNLYIPPCVGKEKSTSIQGSVFNLPFQIAIYHPILRNNYNNIFPPVLSSYIVILLKLFSQRSNNMLRS